MMTCKLNQYDVEKLKKENEELKKKIVEMKNIVHSAKTMMESEIFK